jgi:hypothetical protein
VLHDLAEQVTAVLKIDGAGYRSKTAASSTSSPRWMSGPPPWNASRTPARPGRAWTHGAPARPSPSPTCGQNIVALDLYSVTPRRWSADDLASARILADMAGSYVIHASELDRQCRLNKQLREALDSRIGIEQAKGILAAERQITVDAAFEVLRRHARSHSATLRSVAEAVVSLDMRP